MITSTNSAARGWLIFLLLINLLATPRIIGAAQESSAVCHGLKPDEFMRTWLVLRQASVPADLEKAKKAFVLDYLKPAGGESSIQPKPGDAVELGGADHHWRLI